MRTKCSVRMSFRWACGSIRVPSPSAKKRLVQSESPSRVNTEYGVPAMHTGPSARTPEG